MTAFQQAFSEEAAGARVAGLTAGVVVGGDVVFSGLHEAADTTLFRVASVTKTFTALAVMQLVEQQRIGLDDPVNRHLRTLTIDAPAGAPAVTVRHLLTHQAGLREPLRWSDLARPSRILGPRVGRRSPALADLYRGGIAAHSAPGVAWSYSNDGYAVLGQLIEDVTGTPYASYVAERIWRPLGMRDSTFALGGDAPVAAGHRMFRGRLRPVPSRLVVKAAAGGAYCSLADMLRYASAFADSSGAGLVKTATLEEMLQPQVLLGDRVPWTGLGMFLDRLDGHRVVYHPGDFPGYEAALFVAPDDGVGVVVLCNSSARGTAMRLARRLLTSALGVSDRADVSVSADVAERIVGDYVAEPGWRSNLRAASMTGGRLTVARREGALMLRSRFGGMRRPMELLPVPGEDDLHLRVLLQGMPYDGVPLDVVFAADAEGRVTRLDLGLLGISCVKKSRREA